MVVSEVNTAVEKINSVEHLDDLISEPTDQLAGMMARLDGDIVILGAGGKMGPSLARMAKRASDAAGVTRRITAVSRFSEPGEESLLQQWGVETHKCDLLDPEQVESLPDAANVVFMAGMKFGSMGHEALTWAINAYVPSVVCRKYRNSRIAAFSTGNIYGLTPLAHGGSVETDTPNPEGEYAMSALGRERIFEYFSRTCGTRVSIVRLNYAIEMRYGVLVDVALKVFHEQPVDVSMGNANVIWQGDANAMALMSLDNAASPSFVINVAGPEVVSIRRVAEKFGQLMQKPVETTGSEAPDALLSNGQLGHRLFGYPRVSVDQMVRWIADWVMRGEAILGKPTHFETRDGRF